MWTKNGARTLPLVLSRIDTVIPRECVNRRILVDDQSTDATREIAESFGWQVIFNEGTGVSSGANTALRFATSEFLVSFEQDLILARDWWDRIPVLLEDEKTAVASGVRIAHYPSALKRLQEYTLEGYQRKDMDRPGFLHGKTLDNTIYRTKVIRELGGFPSLPASAGVDNFLARKLASAGFRWRVDYTVRSIHLRSGIRDELAHYYWYGLSYRQVAARSRGESNRLPLNILRFLYSPISGLEVALKKGAPDIVYIYPLIRFNVLKGMLGSKAHRTVKSQQSVFVSGN
jgi:glycosyltransferase involved in cell wall biosynthesis